MRSSNCVSAEDKRRGLLEAGRPGRAGIEDRPAGEDALHLAAEPYLPGAARHDGLHSFGPGRKQSIHPLARFRE